MKRNFIPIAVMALVTVLLPAAISQSPARAPNSSIEDLISRMQQALQARDWQAFGDLFIPEQREEQKISITSYFENIKMEQISIFPVRNGSPSGEAPVIFMQAYYQNHFSALIETWKLTLVRHSDQWLIKKKEVTGNISNLYKLKIPGERVERAESVEIESRDIRLTFRNAYVFYDNIPNLETVLLIIGKGVARFSPDNLMEKHQLELVYNKNFLEEKIEYGFLMFSSNFFQNNIKITNATPVDLRRVAGGEALSNRAYSLFVKYGHRYFSIQNSLTKEPLSFMPQGEDTVIDFWGKKLGDFTYIFSPFSEEEITLFDNTKGRLISLYSPAEKEGQKRMFIKFSQKSDVINYDIDLDFNPDKLFLSAKSRIDFIPRLDDVDALKFKFDSHLEILRIYDSERRELLYSLDERNNILYVYFLVPPVKDQISSIEVFYRGRLEPPSQTTDVVVASQYAETELSSFPRLTTYLYSQAVYWYPFPPGDDYFTSQLRLIVPPAYTSIATGELVESGKVSHMARVTEIEKVGSVYSVFVSNAPVKYISFIVGKLNRVLELPGSPPLQLYISEMVRFAKKNLLDESRSILRFYEGLFGPYPYSNLKIIQRAWSTAGGHSPASFVILNEFPVNPDTTSISSIVPRNSPVDFSQWKEYFIAHEIAHQWWGQGVTWAKYRDQWLSEGMAQFASALYLKSKFGPRSYASLLRKFASWTEQKSVWGPITIGSRLSFFDFQAYQAIIYDKAALILNMLLDMLGEDVFFNGFREFFASYKFKPARTADFLRIMERASGMDLKLFSEKWFDSHLLPEVRITTSVEKRGEEYILKVRADQVNEAFVFPLWISWEENGRTRTGKMIVKEKVQETEFVLSQKPRHIKINPNKAVPGKFY